MGPANHPPGAPMMGAPTPSPHPVMGAADEGPRVSVMGKGDHGVRVGLFGDSDTAFVDSLFTGGTRRALTIEVSPTRRGEVEGSEKPAVVADAVSRLLVKGTAT